MYRTVFELAQGLLDSKTNDLICDHKYQFWILQIDAFLADIGYLVKPLSNH